MTHTPGPWTLYPNERLDGLKNVALGSKYERVIVTEKSATANARLIAAAPDLLRELEWLLASVEHNGTDHKGLDGARSAIAKAKGEA